MDFHHVLVPLDLDIISLTSTNYQILYAQWKFNRSIRPSLLEHSSPQQNPKTYQKKEHKSKKNLLSLASSTFVLKFPPTVFPVSCLPSQSFLFFGLKLKSAKTHVH